MGCSVTSQSIYTMFSDEMTVIGISRTSFIRIYCTENTEPGLFDVVLSDNVYFCCLCFGDHIQKNHCPAQCPEAFPPCFLVVSQHWVVHLSD